MVAVLFEDIEDFEIMQVQMLKKFNKAHWRRFFGHFIDDFDGETMLLALFDNIIHDMFDHSFQRSLFFRSNFLSFIVFFLLLSLFRICNGLLFLVLFLRKLFFLLILLILWHILPFFLAILSVGRHWLFLRKSMLGNELFHIYFNFLSLWHC